MPKNNFMYSSTHKGSGVEGEVWLVARSVVESVGAIQQRSRKSEVGVGGRDVEAKKVDWETWPQPECPTLCAPTP